MNKRLVLVGALVVIAVLAFFTFFVLKPAKPIIDIKGEKLITIADFGSAILNIYITNTVLTAWVIMALLLSFCFLAVRKMSLVPSGLYNFFEAIIEVILNFVASIAGEKNGRRFFPVIATFLIYITFANWLSLTPVFNSIGTFEPLEATKAEFHTHAVVFSGSSLHIVKPGAKTVDVKADACTPLSGTAADSCREDAIATATQGKVGDNEKVGVLAPWFRGINTDLMTPLSFALVSAFFVEMWGITSLGFGTYVSKFLNFKGPIDFFVGFLETIAELARLISFSFRLFGNMMAGEILLLVMSSLLGIIPLVIPFYLLEMFVGLIQAFVFGTLTLVFAVLAISAHSSDEHGEASHAHGA